MIRLGYIKLASYVSIFYLRPYILSPRKKHIILMGFMAVGKSTVGRLLSKKLGIPFIDTDDVIEKKEGRSIAKIFEQEGESYFRQREVETIESLVSQAPHIISTGGGLPCNEHNIHTILTHSHSVWLKLGVDRIVHRLTNDTTRPLATQKGSALKKMVKEKLTARKHYYSKADVVVMAHDDPESIVRRIVEKIERV